MLIELPLRKSHLPELLIVIYSLNLIMHIISNIVLHSLSHIGIILSLNYFYLHADLSGLASNFKIMFNKPRHFYFFPVHTVFGDPKMYTIMCIYDTIII